MKSERLFWKLIALAIFARWVGRWLVPRSPEASLIGTIGIIAACWLLAGWVEKETR